MLSPSGNKETSTRQLRQFGLSLTLALAVIGGLFLLRQRPLGTCLLGLSLVALVLTATAASLLGPVQKWLTLLGQAIGGLLTNLILIGLFYLVITPLALIGHLFRKDFLDTKCDKKASTYWLVKQPPDPQAMERQY